jgi:hypothetical protein
MNPTSKPTAIPMVECHSVPSTRWGYADRPSLGSPAGALRIHVPKTSADVLPETTR